jgi:4-amino-4-deoxy-L-arabinose transferase-like glycosyltransferase
VDATHIDTAAGRAPQTALAVRLVAALNEAWNAAAMRCNPYAAIAVACAALTVPQLLFRGFSADEAAAISVARSLLADGVWRLPHAFGLRSVEDPSLLPWIIAAISAPFGGVNAFTARLPIALFLLLGCVLIYRLLRMMAAGVPASLFGVAVFLVCPLVIRASASVAWDLPVAVMLFFAFYLWWSGRERGSTGAGRALAIAAVLIVAALLKGPPAALPAPPFAGMFDPVLRLLADALPALLAAALYFYARRVHDNDTAGGSRRRSSFVAAAGCYAVAAAVFILVLPGGTTPHYYFPALLPLCVLGGLGYDLLGLGLRQPATADRARA